MAKRDKISSILHHRIESYVTHRIAGSDGIREAMKNLVAICKKERASPSAIGTEITRRISKVKAGMRSNQS